MSVAIGGMSKLLLSLDAFEIAVNRQAKEAVEESVLTAWETARELCPVSPDGSHGNPPGFLRDGIDVRPVKELSNLMQWELYDDVYYASYVCLGTYKMEPQDFMTPAFEEGATDLRARVAGIVLK